MVKNNRKIASVLVIFINIFMVFIFVLMILALLYFFNGSLEMFPTEEQMEKVKIVAVFMMAISVVVELILALIRRMIILYIKRKDNVS